MPGSSAAQRPADRMIHSFLTQGGMGLWFRGVGGPLVVVEDGRPSEWRALVIENLPDGDSAGPCGLAGGMELYAWRERPDTTSLDVLWAMAPHPAAGEGVEFGEWRPCWQPAGVDPGPKLVRAVRTSDGRSSARMANAGAVRMERTASARGKQCRVRERVPAGFCRVSAKVALQVALAPDQDADATRHLEITTVMVPGFRRWISCHGPGSACAPVASHPIPPADYQEQSFWKESDRYRSSWHGIPVHRTTLQVRFESRVDDAMAARIGSSWGAVPEMRGSAGSIVFRFPDPGPATGKFDALLAAISKHPDVAAAYPFPAGGAMIDSLMGSFEAVLDSGPPSGAYLCLAPSTTPEREDSRLCRPFGAAGRVVFDSLPVFDVTLFATCPAGGRTFAAGALRVEPRTMVTIRLPYQQCPRRD